MTDLGSRSRLALVLHRAQVTAKMPGPADTLHASDLTPLAAPGMSAVDPRQSIWLGGSMTVATGAGVSAPLGLCNRHTHHLWTV